MTWLEEDRKFFRSLVCRIVSGKGTFAWKKSEIAGYRKIQIQAYKADEKDVDSVIEGVLADFPNKIRKALTIKKHYPEGKTRTFPPRDEASQYIRKFIEADLVLAPRKSEQD